MQRYSFQSTEERIPTYLEEGVETIVPLTGTKQVLPGVYIGRVSESTRHPPADGIHVATVAGSP